MRQLTADIDGDVSYAEYGGTGRPIVLVHGIGGAHVNWMLLAPHLVDHGRVVAVDLPGFGHSPIAGRSATVQAQAAFLSRFIAHLDQGPAVVIGHSMGGLVSMILAARFPQSVAALVLLDPAVAGGRTSPAPAFSARLLSIFARAPRLSNALIQPLLRRRGADQLVADGLTRAFHDPATIDPELLRAHVELEEARIRGRAAYVGYLQAWRSMRQLARSWEFVNRTVTLRISAPTLLLHGRNDPIVHVSGAETLAALRPDWEVHFLEGAGHDVQMEAPRRVLDALLPWLERALAPAATS